MKNPLPTGRMPSQWPTTKAGVLAIAQDWYEPSRVALNTAAIDALDLPVIEVGAEDSMAAGKMDFSLDETIALSVALNSINYQFWDLQNGAFIRYDFEGIVGAMGMRTAFERAWNDPESPMSKARDGYTLTTEDIRALFGEIPNPESRAQVLNEVLPNKTLEPVIRTLALAISQDGILETDSGTLLANAFPLAYGDPVLKKAQLAISEVWVAGRAQGLELDCDLTAFADYQIPNILRALGALDYAPDLAQAIDGFTPLDYDSQDERAIRAASLLAVERIAANQNVPVAAVDHYLWTRRKEATTPFHLTFTTAY